MFLVLCCIVLCCSYLLLVVKKKSSQPRAVLDLYSEIKMSGCAAFSNSYSVEVVQKWIFKKWCKTTTLFFRAKNFKCAYDCPLLYCLYLLCITIYSILYNILFFEWNWWSSLECWVSLECSLIPIVVVMVHISSNYLAWMPCRQNQRNLSVFSSRTQTLLHTRRHTLIQSMGVWEWREWRRRNISSVSTSDSHILLQQLKSEFHRMEIHLFTVVSIRFINLISFSLTSMHLMWQQCDCRERNHQGQN